MTIYPIVAIKLGGSLLDWPEWPARLRAFLGTMGPRRVVIMIGGGRSVDAIRDLDRALGFDHEQAHALALAALGITARVAASLLPEATLVGSRWGFSDVWGAGRVAIVDPVPLLDDIDSFAPVLKHTWDTTSDSIAARVATHLGAAELVLLKSTPLPPELAGASDDAPDWHAAAEQELVDPEFPRLAAPIPRVRFVCLRHEGY